uniref:Uncharacterized protein n=1 Tax=Arundo donax TaxID=35708 RepID=A0A0A9BVX7_ARUDO
MPRYRIVQPS